MLRPTVLVVDDEESTRKYLARFLTSKGYGVDCLDSGDKVISRLKAGSRPSLLLLDILMPAISGLDVLGEMAKVGQFVPTIVLSAVGRVPTVVQAMRLGAADYLIKPFEESDLEQAIEKVLRICSLESSQPASESAPLADPFDFPSASPKILRLKELAGIVATKDVPVMILGESGVGKEVLARFIHARSSRRDQPFVKVNCAALPGELLESELFGHERGAFTGALREKPGQFELAHKGTIFLDEIGEMSCPLQAKLLQVLQDGEFIRLGGTRPVRVDARVLASTNKRLEAAVREGEFREDLFYRLNVIKFDIPPLRERREDIPVLFNHFVDKYQGQYNPNALPLPPAYLQVFQRYPWPGNVRELENLVKRFLILPDPELALAGLDEADTTSFPVNQEGARSLREVAALAAERAEKELILRTLKETNWNRRQAARKLNVCYKALLNKLHRWQMRGPSDGGANSAVAGP